MPTDKKTTKKAQVKVKDLKAKKDVKGGALFLKYDKFSPQTSKLSPTSSLNFGDHK